MLNSRDGIWVKICGIKDLSTALAAVEAGADAIGFVFAPSPRQIDLDCAQSITSKLPPDVEKVGVFVNSSPQEVEETAYRCGLTAVQLCGDEPPDFSCRYPVTIIRAIRLGEGYPIGNLDRYRADAFLFDTFKAGVYGGTGQVFNWDLLSQIKTAKPVILAGGLSPQNVGEAVRRVKPFGVDVSSGVETKGRKDVEKIRIFIQEAKQEKFRYC